METEMSERKDEQSLRKQAAPVFVFLENTLFIVERVAIFFLIFWSHNPNYMDLAVEFLLLTNFIYTTLLLRELPYDSQWTVGRVLFYIERYAIILAAVHYVFGYSSFWSQAAKVFCFTNTIYIMKFMLFISEKAEKKFNDEKLERMKADHEEVMNQNPSIVEEELTEGRVEQKQEPLKAEVPLEEKVEIVKQDLRLEAEVPLEDKLSEPNKELLKKANGEGNQDLQQPWKTKLDDYFLKMLGLLRDQIEVTQKLVKDLLEEEEDDDDDEEDDEEKEEEGGGKEEEEEDEVDDHDDEDEVEDEDEEDVDYMDEEDDEGEEEEKLVKSVDKCGPLFTSVVRSAKVNLEKGKNNLTAELAAASASPEHYHRIEKDYLEDRNKWEVEKKDLCTKLDATSQAHLAASTALKFYQRSYQKVVNELSVTNSWYQYYLRANSDYQQENRNLLEEKNKLSAKLHSANMSAQFYQACFEDSDKECSKLREDNCNLAEKLFAETLSAQHYQKLFKEMDEKCQKLHEEKDDLAAKLSAVKAACELYRSYLQACRV